MSKSSNAAQGRLAGRVALVTGAGPGLGGAIALAMAQEGANLVVCDIDSEALSHTEKALAATGVECLALRCDVSDSAAVDAMFSQAAERFGTVDILVNNAARVPTSPAEESRRNRHYAYLTTPMERQSLGIVASLSDEDWLKWWDVNMHGVFFCTRAALRSVSFNAHARTVLSSAPLRASKRSRDLSGTFSALYSHRYLLLLSVASPSASSALCSRLRTVSTASTTWRMM